MDEKDVMILDILKSNSDLTSKQISKKLRIPITTVHHRIKKLKETGVIENFTVNVNHKKLGYLVLAYILVEVNYNTLKDEGISQHELASRLIKYDEIENADIVTGETDIILKVRTKTISELDDFIVRILRNIKGINKTKTLIVLSSQQSP